MAIHTVIRSTERAAQQNKPEYAGAVETNRDRVVVKVSDGLEAHRGGDFKDVKAALERAGFRVKLLRGA